MSDKTYAERFGTPSRPDGCPVLIAAALTKVETENAALRRDVYCCPPTSENDYEGFKWRDACEELECENAELKQRIIDDNKAYGCELRDPSGTIWDHAKRLQEENAALKIERNRLRVVLQDIADASGFDNIGNWARNKAKDALRKEAQP